MAQRKKTRSPDNRRPALGITRKAIDIVRKENEVVGGITPHHVKWLTMFTYTQFNTRQASISFDLNSNPRRIIINPRKNDGSNFGVAEWAKLKFMLKYKKVETDLPGYIGLKNFTIEFVRVAPEADLKIEPKKAEDEQSEPS